MTDAQKHDLANVLHVAWRRYTDLLGEPPHGTLPQLKALVELMSMDELMKGIGNKAIAEWYAEGQGHAKRTRVGINSGTTAKQE